MRRLISRGFALCKAYVVLSDDNISPLLPQFTCMLWQLFWKGLSVMISNCVPFYKRCHSAKPSRGHKSWYFSSQRKKSRRNGKYWSPLPTAIPTAFVECTTWWFCPTTRWSSATPVRPIRCAHIQSVLPTFV